MMGPGLATPAARLQAFSLLVPIVALGVLFSSSTSSSQPSSIALQSSVILDGGSGLDDETRGVAVDGHGNVFVTGYITKPGHGRDIWLARFDRELVLQDSTTVAGPAGGDDEGYTIAFDGEGHLYVVGYMTEADAGHNVWLGKFDSDLDLVDEVTVAGSEGGDDDGYGILFDKATDHIYLAGTLRETGQGANIWLGVYDTDLEPVVDITMDGAAHDTDKARFMAFDDAGNLFVSGSMTVDLTRDYDIWIGKFEHDLDFIDQLIVAGPTTDEDKGYGIVFDGDQTVFATGTMIEPGEGYNIWIARLGTDLELVDHMTLDGPAHGEDVAYLMVRDDLGRLYHTGVTTEANGGANIWLARFDGELDLEAWTTIDGPAGGYDTGVGLALADLDTLYVTAVVSHPTRGLDLWVGRFDLSMVFADGFESGSSGRWSHSIP